MLLCVGGVCPHRAESGGLSRKKTALFDRIMVYFLFINVIDRKVAFAVQCVKQNGYDAIVNGLFLCVWEVCVYIGPNPGFCSAKKQLF